MRVFFHTESLNARATHFKQAKNDYSLFIYDDQTSVGQCNFQIQIVHISFCIIKILVNVAINILGYIMKKPTCNDNRNGYFIVLAKLHMYSEKPQIR